MSCCGKSVAVRIERAYVASSSRPKIVRTVKHNLSTRASAPTAIIKPANDREKHRV